MLKTVLIMSLLPICSFAIARDEHRLATGLGIASPNVSSLLNVSTGYTAENPAGVMYQEGPRVSLQIARSPEGENNIGYEGGYSGTKFGIAAGMSGATTVALGAAPTKSIMLGLSYQTLEGVPTYGFGAVINAMGTHRIGAVVNYRNLPTPETQITSYGAGYAYVEKKQTIAVEVSQQNDAAADPEANKVMIGSIAYQKRVESLQVSLAFQKYLNAPIPLERFWLGAGFNGQTWHLGLYSQYRQSLMLVASGFF